MTNLDGLSQVRVGKEGYGTSSLGSTKFSFTAPGCDVDSQCVWYKISVRSSTSGQIYWSDTHQLSTYLDDYHRALDFRVKAPHGSTEVITEVYAPRESLGDFLAEVREDFRRNQVEVIYGTIRWIERDDESFLPWAKQSYACTVLNLHTHHTPEGLEHSARAFRRLIDIAIRHGGSYFLTYHKHATHKQVKTCYPQFAEFLRLKRKYDPEERFLSDWYLHYKKMFTDVL